MLATLPESDNMFRVAHDIAHDAELPNMRTAQTLRWLNITRGVTVEKPHKPGHYRAIEVPSWFAILYFGLIHELHKPDVEKHNLGYQYSSRERGLDMIVTATQASCTQRERYYEGVEEGPDQVPIEKRKMPKWRGGRT